MDKMSCNSVFNDDNSKRDYYESRLRKAFHAFKSDPSEYNFNRIANVVRSAGKPVYVENAVASFTQSIVGRDRYSDYLHSFSELVNNENTRNS